MNAIIRPAVQSDVDALIALSRRTINASYRSFLGDEAVDSFIGSGSADRFVSENIGHCSVLVQDGRILGYAVCRENVIDLVMIDHAYHRQGLGTMLLRHVEGTLFQTFAELRLESFEDNENANAFYRKNGWREVGRSADKDSGLTKIVFQKNADESPP